MSGTATGNANALDDCYRRNLTLRAERNRLDHQLLTVFANAADVLLHRGLAYALGVGEGRKPLELARDLDRPIRRLERMAELAEAYGAWDHEELENATFLAASRQAVRMQTFAACIESEARLLRTLAPTAPFAGCLLEWREIEAAGNLPPAEFVAYCLAGDWGACLNKEGLPEVACHLAAALGDAQLTTGRAMKVLAKYQMQLLTPALANTIATTVHSWLDQRRRRKQTGSCPAT